MLLIIATIIRRSAESGLMGASTAFIFGGPLPFRMGLKVCFLYLKQSVPVNKKGSHSATLNYQNQTVSSSGELGRHISHQTMIEVTNSRHREESTLKNTLYGRPLSVAKELIAHD